MWLRFCWRASTQLLVDWSDGDQKALGKNWHLLYTTNCGASRAAICGSALTIPCKVRRWYARSVSPREEAQETYRRATTR